MTSHIVYILMGVFLGCAFYDLMIYRKKPEPEIKDTPEPAPVVVIPPKRTKGAIDAEWMQNKRMHDEYMKEIVFNQMRYRPTSLEDQERHDKLERETWNKVHECDRIMDKCKKEYKEAK